MNKHDFDRAERLSLIYRGLAFDDARRIAGVWYYRDPATTEILRFEFQDQITVLLDDKTEPSDAGRAASPSGSMAGVGGTPLVAAPPD